MPADGRKYISTPKILSAEDKLFIKLVSSGMNRTTAFKQAFPNHHNVKRYADVVKDGEDAKERTRLSTLINQAAQTKMQSKYIQAAVVTYQKKMELFSEHAVETAIDLVKNARSEKVRADLAIEGMRHQVGTPVQKIAVKEEKTVILTFGTPPKDRNLERTIIDL